MSGLHVQSSWNAVIYRTHFWDEFVQRQFDRVLERAGGCDIFVLVDETNGAVSGIQHDKIVRVTESSVAEMGLPRAGEGNLLWFNGDYPLYQFMALYPDYLQYFQLEYDVAINIDIGSLLARMRSDGIDFIGLSKGEPSLQWPWRHSCADLYELAQYKHELICICAFSARALDYLFRKRRQHAALLASGVVAAWPMCEAFIATELSNGGFRMAELSSYGDTEAYDHWPPYLEDDLARLAHHQFIHPVLDQRRFIASMLKYHVGISGYFRWNSLFHRKLRRLPTTLYLRTLVESFVAKVSRVIREATNTRHKQDMTA